MSGRAHMGDRPGSSRAESVRCVSHRRGSAERRRAAARRHAPFSIAAILCVVTLGGVGACASRVADSAPDHAAPHEEMPSRPPVGRVAAESAEFAPVDFDPPRAERLTLSNGITVFYLEDRSLPLVDVFASFKGGSVYFERDDFAAARAVGPLMLSGGTTSLSPDSVAALIEFYALSPSFTTGGSRSAAGIGTLSRHLGLALELWTDMLRNPRFDPDRVEVWRRRELDLIRRSHEAPGAIAISEFNRLMYGDHPVGWIMDEDDLEPELLETDRLRRVHGAIYCADHLILGITGDVGRDEALEALESAFGDWPTCPGELGPSEPLCIRDEPAVRVIHRDLEQSTVIMGQAGRVVRNEADTFTASQLANFILGGGGLSSRLMERLRTERGLAYSAWSTWGAGSDHERLFGAFTQTRADETAAAMDEIYDVLETMRSGPPADDELRDAVDNTVNGFVFAFENVGDIVARQMTYMAGGMPEDWLERYIDQVQQVSPNAVHDVFTQRIRPDSLSIVIVGDTSRFELPDRLRERIIP